jgi:hypothetical protein
MQKTCFMMLLPLLWPLALFASEKVFLLQDSCVRCHFLCENKAKENSVIAWKKSVHFRPDSGCSDCHGGDRFFYMDFKPGHMGIPDRAQTVVMCEKCHEPQVHDFVQRRRPVPGKTMCAATCVNCHGYHRVAKADSGIITKTTCGGCHSLEPAQKIFSATKAVETTMDAVKEKRGQYQEAGFPVRSIKTELESIQRQYSRAFHSVPLSKLEEHLASRIMDSLHGLMEKMERSTPAKWWAQGVAALAFLAAVIILLAFFQKAVNKRKGGRQ